MMTPSSWYTLQRWMAGGALYGLAWGTLVALTITLSANTPSLETTWLAPLLSRTQLGALTGCFFGTLAGLILAKDRLRLNPMLLNGWAALLLLGTFALWFGGGALLYQTLLTQLLRTIDWADLVANYPPLFAVAPLLVIPLALPPLLLGHSHDEATASPAQRSAVIRSRYRAE